MLPSVEKSWHPGWQGCHELSSGSLEMQHVPGTVFILGACQLINRRGWFRHRKSWYFTHPKWPCIIIYIIYIIIHMFYVPSIFYPNCFNLKILGVHHHHYIASRATRSSDTWPRLKWNQCIKSLSIFQIDAKSWRYLKADLGGFLRNFPD